MKSAEYIKKVAEHGGFTQKDVRAVLKAAGEVAYASAVEDDVPIFNGLTLYTKITPARIGRNPLTGESIEIPEKRVPKAKFGKLAKTSVAL